MRGADQRHRAHRPRVQDRRGPTHEAAIGVADECCRPVSQRAHQTRGIPRQRPSVIAARRLVAAAVAAQIDRHNAGRGQPPKLMPPGEPERPESVQQQDQRSGCGRSVVIGVGKSFDALESDAVRVNIVVAPRARDAGDRRVRTRRHHPDGSVAGGSGFDPAPGTCAAGEGDDTGPFRAAGVSAAVVSRTEAMVSCGPRILRTRR